MTTLDRWDYAKKAYVPHRIPDEWKTKVYSENMDERINCACCGKQFTFGKGYTSLEIHDPLGFGYIVCPKCHEDEIIRRQRYGR